VFRKYQAFLLFATEKDEALLPLQKPFRAVAVFFKKLSGFPSAPPTVQPPRPAPFNVAAAIINPLNTKKRRGQALDVLETWMDAEPEQEEERVRTRSEPEHER